MELREQVFARLHSGRNALLDMIQECCHSLHQEPACQRHVGTTCPESDVADRGRSAMSRSMRHHLMSRILFRIMR